jgi:hypothetical protein
LTIDLDGFAKRKEDMASLSAWYLASLVGDDRTKAWAVTPIITSGKLICAHTVAPNESKLTGAAGAAGAAAGRRWTRSG